MIIDPREVIKLTRELIAELRELRTSVDALTKLLSQMEVKQDALEMEIASLSKNPLGPPR